MRGNGKPDPGDDPRPRPRPTPGPPPPPFQPADYTVRLDWMQIMTTRSRHTDTDRVSLTVAVNQTPPVTVAKDMGDLNDGTYPVGLSVPVRISDPMDVLVVNYLIVNAGHKDWATVNGVLTQAGTQLASAGAKAAASAIASGVGAAVGATIGGVVLPVVGSILGAAAGWLAGEVTGLLTADCDGTVAAEQAVLLGKELWGQSQHGPLSRGTFHDGTDSPGGCGDNSRYQTGWSVTRS